MLRVTLNDELNAHITSEQRTTVISLQNFAVSITETVLILIFSRIADKGGLQLAFQIATITLFILMFTAFIKMRNQYIQKPQ